MTSAMATHTSNSELFQQSTGSDNNNNYNKKKMPPSLRFSGAETAILSNLLQEMRVEGDPRTTMKATTPITERLEAMLSCRMREISSFRENVAKQQQTHAKKRPIVDHFGDKGIFTGEVRYGEPHGNGRIEYDDGRIYEGKWSEGRYHGNGRLTFVGGDTYIGDFRHDLRRCSRADFRLVRCKAARRRLDRPGSVHHNKHTDLKYRQCQGIQL